MTWVYHQKSGEIYHNASFEGHGYSGRGGGRNNPQAEHIASSGPIPKGHYRIGDAYKHDHLGPVVMNLDPLPGTDTHGRSLFRIHGDNARHDASQGCIILGPSIRKEIAASFDKELEVIE